MLRQEQLVRRMRHSSGTKFEHPESGDRAFTHLAEKCTYLIHVRGYEAWTL
jgi:hypothetical protein